jgi:glutaconate CoA-transferase, subunit A
MDKLTDLRTAISTYVHDGDTVVMEGFTHLIPFAAAHEIIRQNKRGLTLVRLTPDLIYDQMIAAGCCKKLIFSWAGNPGVGSLHAFRRAVAEKAVEIEEYSHFGLAMRLFAGASNLPFMPIRSYIDSDLPTVNPLIRRIESPYDGESLYAVPCITPEVAILHAQRADREGNVQSWGISGAQKEAAFASRNVIVTVEEIVSEAIIRSDPNRTLLPGMKVSAVCVVPFGAHPSYAQGYYDRDTQFYLDWDLVARDAARLQQWLREWVFEADTREAYLDRVGSARLEALRATPQYSESVNYGHYR